MAIDADAYPDERKAEELLHEPAGLAGSRLGLKPVHSYANIGILSKR